MLTLIVKHQWGGEVNNETTCTDNWILGGFLQTGRLNEIRQVFHLMKLTARGLYIDI